MYVTHTEEFFEWRAILFFLDFVRFNVEGYALQVIHLPLKVLLSASLGDRFDSALIFFFLLFFVTKRVHFEESYCRLAFTMNVLYVALGFVFASLPMPQCEQQQCKSLTVGQTVHRCWTDASTPSHSAVIIFFSLFSHCSLSVGCYA